MRKLLASLGVMAIGATLVANVSSSPTQLRIEKLPCQTVGSIPYTINAPGKYCLSSDFTTNALVAISVASSNVILDCKGHSLQQSTLTSGTEGIEIATGNWYSTVRNCNVINFDSGLAAKGTNWNLQLLNNRIEGAAHSGISASSADGMYITGNKIVSTNGSSADGIGILATAASVSLPMKSLIISDNVMAGVSSTQDAYGIKIKGANTPQILSNQVLDVSSAVGKSANAIYLSSVSHAVVSGNSFMSRGTTPVSSLGTDGQPDATCAGNIAIGLTGGGFANVCQTSTNDTELP